MLRFQLHAARTLVALLATLSFVTIFAGAGLEARQDDDVAEVVAELKKSRDDADEELIEKLGEMGTREAMEGLVEVYDSMASIYMKLKIVTALESFDGIGEAEQPAMQKIMEIATGSRDLELREASVDALGRCRSLGKTFLVMIVESNAMGDVRERAMLRHTEFDTDKESDAAWYKKIWESQGEEENKKKKKAKRKKKGDEETEERKPRPLQSIRLMAFDSAAEFLTDAEVEDAASEDRNKNIQRSAMWEIKRRGNERKAEQIARDVFKSVMYDGVQRSSAAELLAAMHGEDMAKDFIDMASKVTTPDKARQRMAELLAEMDGEKVKRAVTRIVGKGKPHEKRFAMIAAQNIEDKKVDKAMRRGLTDKDETVQLLAIEMIGKRKDMEALEDLQKLVEKSKDEEVIAASLGAWGEIDSRNKDWREKLVGYASGDTRELRNAALRHLGDIKSKKHKDLLLAGLVHDDWSTRLAALKALAALRDPTLVGAIIEQMPNETGRMTLEFGTVLWKLTGKPYQTRTTAWQNWWKAEGSTFELVSESELARLEAEERDRRLKARTSTPSFFGIRIISERVIFVLDVSGSMAWELGGENSSYGDPVRIDVAKKELMKVLENLNEDALFNMIVFSSDVNGWLDDGIAGSTKRTRDEAIEYVERLGAGGGTNIHGAFQAAFEDPDVDTIVFLSDGEPTVGDVTDPERIRADVKTWNENRDITIHTIAVGMNLQVLEWISEDSGGTHVKYQ